MKTLRPTAAARIARWQALSPKTKDFIIELSQGMPYPTSDREMGWAAPGAPMDTVACDAILSGFVSDRAKSVTTEFRALYLDLFGVNPYDDAAELEDYRSHRGDLITAVTEMVRAEEDGSGYWAHVLEVLNR